MILAGGTGRELSVLTRHRAKTALPFGGRYRIVDFCLSNCVRSGILDIAVLAQYKPKSLIDHIRMGKPWDLDRRSGGVSIMQPTYNGEATQWYLGTADALYQNIETIRESDADAVLVLSGDQVYLMDYGELIDEHIASGRPATLVYKKVGPSQVGRFGMVRRSAHGLITEFREKPRSSNFRFASLGIYVFDRRFLLETLGPDKIDIVFDILMPLVEQRGTAGHLFEGYWEDVGSVRSYFRASMRLLGERSMLSEMGRHVFTRGEDLPPARFAASSDVSGSIVANGCDIRGTVRNSILFPGVRVDRNAVIEDSIVFSFARVGKKARVRRAILDKHAAIGERASIGVIEASDAGAVPAETRGVETKLTQGIAIVGKSGRVSRGVDLPAGFALRPRTLVREGTA